MSARRAGGPPRRRRWRWPAATAAVVVIALVGAVAWRLPPPTTDLADPPTGTLDVAVTGTWDVGEFTVELAADAVSVTHPDAAATVWSTPPGAAFLTAATGQPSFRDDVGLLRIADEHTATWADQHIASATLTGEELVLAGQLTGDADPVAWELTIREGADRRLDLDAAVTGSDADRLYLTAARASEESVHGMGAQSGDFDLRGRRVPLLSREQGIGRGRQPLSLAVDLVQAAAGGQDTTYLVSGVNVTSAARSLAYRGSRIASADLRGEHLVWEVWDSTASFSAVAATTPLEAVKLQTGWTGVAGPPPAWTQEGVVAGLQGGTAEVRRKLGNLRDAGVPVAAVWLQDWSGRRVTDFGDRLQWNWVLDQERYPGWDELVAELAADGTRVLTYTNAFLSADSGAASAARGGRDLYAEAESVGYLVRDADGAVAELDQHGFSAALVDLSDPAAREWLAEVIAEEVAGAGVSGWMADFAEGPPPDARLSGGSGEEWRAVWPVLWQQVNNRALDLAGLSDDGFVFHRSGHSASAGAADALWLGDQLQDWSAQDGLASVPSLLHATAASGMAQVHSDVGGYTGLALPVVPDIRRDAELVARWAEAAVLGPVLRTHEGNRPTHAAQPAEDPELAADLAAAARLFVALTPERERLTRTNPLGAAQHHPWMHHPDSPELIGRADAEIMLGPDVLLAPVLGPGEDTATAVLPPGRWLHPWSGRVLGDPAAVTEVTVDTPVGRPAIFARAGSAVAAELADHASGEQAGAVSGGPPGPVAAVRSVPPVHPPGDRR